MNRGFCYYFNKGVRTAASVIYKGGRFFAYYAYWFASLIGRVIPFFGAIFPVADVRRAKIAEREKSLPVLRSFGGVDTARSFGAALLAFAIEGLILLGGLAAFAAVGYLLFVLGGEVGILAELETPEILAWIFAVPAIAAQVIYLVGVAIFFAPTAYIVDSNEDITATRVLTASAETMRRGGKFTCFMNTFVPLLIKGVYITGVYFGARSIFSLSLDPIVVVLLFTAVLLVALIGYLLFAPIFTLGSAIANVCLFGDIALDPSALDNRTKGVFVKHCVNDMPVGKGLDNNLSRLFDSAIEQPAPTYTGYVPPTDPSPQMRFYTPESESEQQAPQREPSSEATERAEEPAQTVAAEQPAPQATISEDADINEL